MSMSEQDLKTHLKSGFEIIRTIADAIRELKEVPSGVLYSHVMDKLDLPAYDRVISILKKTGLVTEENHVLKWVGPKEQMKYEPKP